MKNKQEYKDYRPNRKVQRQMNTKKYLSKKNKQRTKTF